MGGTLAGGTPEVGPVREEVSTDDVSLVRDDGEVRTVDPHPTSPLVTPPGGPTPP